ncbi:MAG: PAS domain S-box protein [Sulfurovum sp.]|nr:PAS domain S-box protein [Sulfurovum sp.]
MDGYSLLLAFFFIFLLLLMGYLYKIDHDIRNYDRYHHRLDKMRLLTYKFDNVFQQTYRYINYDSTSELEKHFQGLIDKFDEEPVKKEFGPEVYTLIIKVKTEFNEILYYFEDFKALNARVTNSIHYLFDLRKTLERKLVEDKETQILVDNIFFSLSQILMQLPYDEQRIQKDISLLQSFTLDYPMLVYFIQHTHQFLKDVKKIATLKEKVASVPLRPSINRLLDTLEMTYRTKREQQRIIAISLFGFAFMILGLLIFSYRRIQKNAKELQAFRYAIEQSDNAIVLTNAGREIEYVNRAFEEKSGYSKEEVIGKNPNILKSNLLSDNFYKELNSTIERGEIWQGELVNRRKDGSLLYEKASIIPIFIDGELVQYLAVKLDITEYKEQQQKLKQAAVVYNMIGDGILVTDSQKRIISVNPSFVAILGYEEEELLGS